MSDLTPFKDDDGALDADERRLLRAGLGVEVPRGAKRTVWMALAASLPGVAAASTATTGVLTAASLVKYGAVGVLLGATTMTTVALVRSPPVASSGAPAPAVVVTAPPPSRPAEAPRVVAPLLEAPAIVTSAAAPSAGAPPAAVAPVPVPPSTVASPLDTESRRVAAARALQRAGRTREALAALDGLARDLPNGELVQEREALAIEALVTLGNTAEARRRASSFLQRFPNSPHAAAARRALE